VVIDDAMINPNLKFPEEKIADFCRRNRVKRLSLFGSAARNDFRPDSDVDLLVEFDENARVTLFDMVDLQDELSQIFGGRSVDLVTPSVLRNPFRRRSIEKDLEAVYVS
jgi:uncharacterized protein